MKSYLRPPVPPDPSHRQPLQSSFDYLPQLSTDSSRFSQKEEKERKEKSARSTQGSVWISVPSISPFPPAVKPICKYIRLSGGRESKIASLSDLIHPLSVSP